MQCPCCNSELKRKSTKNIEIDECPECKGIWFEDDELRKAKDVADSDLNWMDFEIWKHKNEFKIKESPRSCPVCKTDTKAIDYGSTSTEIDYCPSCKGVWLDRGEFKKIINALEKELLTKSFSNYISATIKEVKEIITGPESILSEWKDFITVFRLMRHRMFVENPKLVDGLIKTYKISPFK